MSPFAAAKIVMLLLALSSAHITKTPSAPAAHVTRGLY